MAYLMALGIITIKHFGLRLMSDAPAHRLFVLLAPVDQTTNSLPEILCVIQVALEGAISKQSAQAHLAKGHAPQGDLIPWNVSQQYQVRTTSVCWRGVFTYKGGMGSHVQGGWTRMNRDAGPTQLWQQQKQFYKIDVRSSILNPSAPLPQLSLPIHKYNYSIPEVLMNDDLLSRSRQDDGIGARESPAHAAWRQGELSPSGPAFTLTGRGVSGAVRAADCAHRNASRGDPCRLRDPCSPAAGETVVLTSKPTTQTIPFSHESSLEGFSFLSLFSVLGLCTARLAHTIAHGQERNERHCVV
eukprot:425147-Pyramimonas_sp.AAC.1